MVSADTRKERKPNRRLVEGLGGVLMRKSGDLWWEHKEVTAGKGKVVSWSPRL